MQQNYPDEYTLWLKPSSMQKYTLYKQRIQATASAAGTIPFLPHLTLLPGMRGDRQALIRKTKRLAATLGPMKINPYHAAQGASYFKSLFLLCEKSPDLVAANKKATQLFGHRKMNFQPHVSLAYGFPTSPLKSRFLADLNKVDAKTWRFNASEISLWYAHGPPDEWEEIARFPLKK